MSNETSIHFENELKLLIICLEALKYLANFGSGPGSGHSKKSDPDKVGTLLWTRVKVMLFKPKLQFYCIMDGHGAMLV